MVILRAENANWLSNDQSRKQLYKSNIIPLYKPITEINDKSVQDFERDQREMENDVIISSLKLKEIIFKKLNFSDYQ